MKKNITLFFICFTLFLNAQMRLVWSSNIKDLTFLKNEKKLKLIYNLDSFSVKGMLQSEIFKNDTKPLFDSIKDAFEVNFNKVSKKKIRAIESLVKDSFNYVLKITPLKFEVFRVDYRSTPSQNGYPGSPACNSDYFKASYIIEIINRQNSLTVASLTLSNLTNKFPMRSNCGRNKYSKNINTEIYRSMIRAGTETAKYILKSRKIRFF